MFVIGETVDTTFSFVCAEAGAADGPKRFVSPRSSAASSAKRRTEILHVVWGIWLGQPTSRFRTVTRKPGFLPGLATAITLQQPRGAPGSSRDVRPVGRFRA